MAEQHKNRWNWEVPGFEPRKSVEQDDHTHSPPLHRRYSISAASLLPHSELSKLSLSSKLDKLKDKVKHAKEDYLELRQEASDLQEYSNAKLDRVTRYLGVLADRARKLDQVALETEARISPLIVEKKRLYNDLLTAKGNVKVYCRTRPLFEDEGPSVVEFPDDFTIRINTGDTSISNPKKDFEFDRVYGPHVGQGELFNDVQPFVQSALDGYNVSVFAYGQTHSGKTHTMEGSSQERGLYVRCFEELFDLSNSDTTSTSRFDFYVTVFELYNEQNSCRRKLIILWASLKSLKRGFKIGEQTLKNPMSLICMVQILYSGEEFLLRCLFCQLTSLIYKFLWILVQLIDFLDNYLPTSHLVQFTVGSCFSFLTSEMFSRCLWLDTAVRFYKGIKSSSDNKCIRRCEGERDRESLIDTLSGTEMLQYLQG